MKRLMSAIFLMFATVTFFGCAGKTPLLPAYDKVHVYPLAFDRVYMNALTAAATVQDWDVEATDKELGMLRIRNTNYGGFNKSDQRVVVLKIRRISRDETSLEVEKQYQQVVGLNDIMKAVDSQLKELKA